MPAEAYNPMLATGVSISLGGLLGTCFLPTFPFTPQSCINAYFQL
jgi:hypothetical protein